MTQIQEWHRRKRQQRKTSQDNPIISSDTPGSQYPSVSSSKTTPTAPTSPSASALSGTTSLGPLSRRKITPVMPLKPTDSPRLQRPITAKSPQKLAPSSQARSGTAANSKTLRKPRQAAKTSPRIYKPKPKLHQIIFNSPTVRKWTADIVSFTALFAFCATMVGGAWISYRWIVDPDAAAWLNQFLPEGSQIPVSNNLSMQTLDQIKTNLKQEGLIAGNPWPLVQPGDKITQPNLLLPVSVERPPSGSIPCENPCRQLVELRVYQPVVSPYQRPGSNPYFRLVNQLPIEGPAASSVIAAIDQSEQKAVSTESFPLTTLSRFNGKVPTSGLWFNLIGKRLQGNKVIPYGQVVHYNPGHSHLMVMAEWVSAAGQIPTWRDITGEDELELVVDQTVGLEPKFDVYQVQPRQFVQHPLELVQISLAEPVMTDRVYRNSLQLAERGLWSPALALMKPLSSKQSSLLDPGWSAAAQAQLDVIQFHAKITTAQATTPWASTNQKVLADLIDGRWNSALELFESDLQSSYEISKLLKADAGQIWNRVAVSLKVNPEQTEVKAWGALIVATQEGRNQAESWLDEQSKTTKEEKNRIGKILDQLDAAVADAELLKRHISQIVGAVSPLNEINPDDWEQPQSKKDLKLGSQQVWYQIQVASFHDGKQWRRPPFTNLFNVEDSYIQTKMLWRRLGLHNDAKIRIGVWLPDGQQKNTIATVKAIHIQDGSIKLLAAGDSIGDIVTTHQLPQPLAFTESALQWVQPQTFTVASLNQQQPQLVTKMLPTLWQELQAAGQLPPGVMPAPEEILRQVGNWFVQTIDLTGNHQPEAVLTVRSNGLAALGQTPSASRIQSWPRTLIFSDAGALIYSEFTKDDQQFLTGLVDMRDGGLVALVVDDPKNYRLQRWSGEKQRFE